MELVQNKEGLVATLTVKISQEDYATNVEKELRKARQTIQIKGFRPGNVPISLIKKMYGQSVLVDEINRLLTGIIENYEKENSERLMTRIIPANENLTTLTDQTDFEFVYFAGFFPEFTYQINEDTELNYYNILFEDTEVDDEIKHLCDSCGTYKKVKEIEDGCIIYTNIELEKDGKILYNKIISIADVPDEYKSVFNGAKVGDVVNVEIRKVFINEVDLMELLEVDQETFELLPETLPFAIIEVLKENPAELNQEFFDKMSEGEDIHNEDEFKEYIRKKIASEYEELSLSKLYDDSIEILMEKANVTLPEDFMEKYLLFAQKDAETSEKSLEFTKNSFIKNTKWLYIIESLFKQADIRITREEIKNEAKRIIIDSYRNIDDTYTEQLSNYYLNSEEGIKYVLEKVRIQKFAKLLKDNAKLNVIDIAGKDFLEIYNVDFLNKKENREIQEQRLIATQEQENEETQEQELIATQGQELIATQEQELITNTQEQNKEEI
jgi:trigger factor